jgi:glutathione S-transferase
MAFYFQVFGFDVSKYPNVAKWYARAQKTIVGYKEINEEGARELREFIKKFEK